MPKFEENKNIPASAEKPKKVEDKLFEGLSDADIEKTFNKLTNQISNEGENRLNSLNLSPELSSAAKSELGALKQQTSKEFMAATQPGVMDDSVTKVKKFKYPADSLMMFNKYKAAAKLEPSGKGPYNQQLKRMEAAKPGIGLEAALYEKNNKRDAMKDLSQGK